MFQQIFFDCDSTLTTIEGIDELTTEPALKKQIQQITHQAMIGRIDFKTALKQRLFLLNPTKKDLQKIGQQYIKNVFPGAKKLITLLKSHNQEIFIISGGLKTAILPFAKHLGIPQTNVFANEITFDQKGRFQELNTKNPLIHTNGKAQLMRSHRILNPHKKTVFIGDGITDLATKPFVDRFIGFGSTQSRPEVKNQSPYFFKEKNILQLLPFLT